MIRALVFDCYGVILPAAGRRDEQVLALIESARQTYQTALLTNMGRGSLLHRFSETELQRYFDVVAASGDIGYAKPHSEAYRWVLERLAIPAAEAVMIDDSPDCCAGAAALGMQTIQYQDVAQLQRELAKLTDSQQ